MHSLVLVIYPYDVELKDVMYPYQEIDKSIQGRMHDERCQFFSTVKEEEIPSLLNEIKSYIVERKEKYLEMMQYRSEHTVQEFKEKYNHLYDCYESYIHFSKKLTEYESVKDLPYDDPKQIKFIKYESIWATDKAADIYIKGKGYGLFHNPYEIWDYYQSVTERFTNGTLFLVSKNNMKTNTLYLNELDVDKTVNNINSLTYVWENIIFCEANPSKSKLYTTDVNEYNENCLVDNLKDKLIEISNINYSENYIVTAIDCHR